MESEKKKSQIVATKSELLTASHKIKSTLNKYASRIFYYNVTRCEEWVNN